MPAPDFLFKGYSLFILKLAEGRFRSTILVWLFCDALMLEEKLKGAFGNMEIAGNGSCFCIRQARAKGRRSDKALQNARVIFT